MKQNRIKTALVLVAFIGLLSFTQVEKNDTYNVLTDKSELVWTGRKVGGEHKGTINIKSGSFNVEKDIITSGNFIIDMTTINVTDTENKKLYNHLISEDFFNVAKYPESQLVITGSKKDGKKLLVTGTMTILDKTNPITFTANQIAKTASILTYTANITIDRTKYGIVYKSSAVGEAMINDEFDIKVKLTGSK